jgi:uncharacterized membrane protein
MSVFIIGLILFFGTHSVSIVSPAWRDRMAARIGEIPWKALYSVVAIIGLVLMVWGYGLARQDWPILYFPPLWLRHVAALLMIFAFPVLLATYLPGRIQQATKHPMLVATKLWALAHLLSNGSIPDVLLFGSFLAWAVADRMSMKRRQQRPIHTAQPSKLNDLIAVMVGLGLYAVFVMGAHRWLFGVSPMA